MTRPCVSGRNFETRPVPTGSNIHATKQWKQYSLTSHWRGAAAVFCLSHRILLQKLPNSALTTRRQIFLAAAIRRVPSSNPPTHFHYIFPSSGAAKVSPELYNPPSVGCTGCNWPPEGHVIPLRRIFSWFLLTRPNLAALTYDPFVTDSDWFSLLNVFLALRKTNHQLTMRQPSLLFKRIHMTSWPY